MPPEQHRVGFWILSILFHIPLYLMLLARTRDWWKGGTPPSYGFLVLLYWTYWAEHAVIWGDPRFGLAVYPLLVLFALPRGTGGICGVNGGSIPAPA
jgi:hypothetical protein